MSQAGAAEESEYDETNAGDPYDNIDAGTAAAPTPPPPRKPSTASSRSEGDGAPSRPSLPAGTKGGQKGPPPPVPDRKPSFDAANSGSPGSSGTPPRVKPRPPPKPPAIRSGSETSSTSSLASTTSSTVSTVSTVSGAPPPLPPRNEQLSLTGWFRKAPERSGFGSSKLRFFELHGKQVRYFTGVHEDGTGSGPKGKIDLSGSVDVKVAGRSLAITTGTRYYSLTAESDAQAQVWGDALQKTSAAAGEEESEIDMLPAHGDWMLKRGKGIGKYADDKVRYFTLVHVRETGRLRINYYVQLAGRSRIPLNKKGFIAIDYSSRIIRTDRKLQIANPGFTWQLTCYSMATAKRWERILANAIAENVHLNEAAAADRGDPGKLAQLPVLARAHEMVSTARGRPPNLQVLLSNLRAEYDGTKVEFWETEISNTLAIYEGTARRPTIAADPGPELSAWFTKHGRISGKRAWYEVEGPEIKWYKSPPTLEQAGPGRSATAVAVSMRAHTANVPAFHSDGAPSSAAAGGVNSMDQERGTLIITRETTVDCNLKDHTLYISTGSQSAWLIADSGTVAVEWAEAIQKAVGMYGQCGMSPDGGMPGSPAMRRPAAPPRPRVAPRPSLRERPTRPLSLYEIFDEDEDNTVDVVGRAKVLYEYTERSENEMSLFADEVISLLTAEDDSGWWEGVTTVAGILRTGWFPSAYVVRVDWSKDAKGGASTLGSIAESGEAATESLYVDTDDDDEVDAAAEIVADEPAAADESEAGKQARKLRQTIEEIVQTERDYVKKLYCMGKGYVTPMRPLVGELIDDGAIGTLFCNIEQLLQGQAAFLEELEVAAASNDPSKVAGAFTNSLPVFRLYSPYCNNHPRAVETLEKLVAEDDRIWSFFEGCRMMLDGELSVSALMIKPVQRICQYPMLLSELQKRTEGTEHHEQIKEVGVVVREIALTINEEKRKQEEVRALSDKFDGWNGPPLTVYSSMLYCQGPLKKISGNVAHDRYCFLFDNLLVMARRNVTSDRYKVTGTMFTQGCTLADVPDGEYTHNKAPIFNAFRVYNIEKDKWYIMVAKSPTEKSMWVDGFDTEEKHTADNVSNGMNLVEMSSTEIGAMHGVKGKKMQRKKKARASTHVKRKVAPSTVALAPASV